MQPTSAPAPCRGSSSFAGMLADLTAPEEKFCPARDLDGLQDDVATISYEQALRAHARFRPQAATPKLAIGDAPAAERTAPLPNTFAAVISAVPEAQGRKSASVTVRMSAAECEQLRWRASEAGMTVSAYLRSCAFEVETLRAQVKDALTKLKPESHQHRRNWRVWRWLRS